jgi:hypothetical protein
VRLIRVAIRCDDDRRITRVGAFDVALTRRSCLIVILKVGMAIPRCR